MRGNVHISLRWRETHIARALGIASVVVVAAAFFVPYGWLLACGVALLLASAAATLGDRVFATITLLAMIPHMLTFLQLFFVG